MGTSNTFESRYKNKRAIGSGSNGMVYCYLDKQTKKKVAVKEMCIGAIDFEEIKKEKLILEQLDSPHIVKLINHIEDEKENVYRLVMEYCSGGSLDKRERFNDDELLIVAEHILNGLAHMHSKGYIHRDIKPANLLYCDDEEAPIYKLGDVGESKNIAESIKTRRGSLKYMAPEVKNVQDLDLEQMKGGKQTYYDKSADIWSFGATILELGEGEDCIIHSPPKFKRIQNEKLRMMITRCLIDDPTKRANVSTLKRFVTEKLRDLLLRDEVLMNIGEREVEESCLLSTKFWVLSRDSERKIKEKNEGIKSLLTKYKEWKNMTRKMMEKGSKLNEKDIEFMKLKCNELKEWYGDEIEIKSIIDRWSKFYDLMRFQYAWWLTTIKHIRRQNSHKLIQTMQKVMNKIEEMNMEAYRINTLCTRFAFDMSLLKCEWQKILLQQNVEDIEKSNLWNNLVLFQRYTAIGNVIKFLKILHRVGIEILDACSLNNVLLKC